MLATTLAVKAMPPKPPPKQRPSIFGVNLLTARKQADLTQEQLAERSGVSRGTIANLERGEAKTPDVDTQEKLAAALGVDQASLWRGSQEESAQFLPNPWKQAAPAAGVMTADEFTAKHAGRLVGHEVATILKIGRTRPGMVAAWTEENWLAFARILREEYPPEL